MVPHCPEISDNKHIFVLETHRPIELEDSGDTKTPIDKTPDQVVVREDPSMVEERPPRVWNSVLCGSNHHPARQIDAARVRARVLSDVSGTASYRGRGDGFRGSEQRPLVLSHEKTKETTHFG